MSASAGPARPFGQYRSTQRHRALPGDDEDALTAAIVALARRYGRYGYLRITELLQMAGWSVNAWRVQRIWRAEGLKVPAEQPKRGRLWLADGSCIRLRPQQANHVWAYDFVSETTHEGRKLALLTVIDEYTRECLAIGAKRRITSRDVLYALSELLLEHGIPEHIRSDHGPEFVAQAVCSWLTELGATSLFVEPASPWENGYIESFNGKPRDELLHREPFYTLKEAQILGVGSPAIPSYTQLTPGTWAPNGHQRDRRRHQPRGWSRQILRVLDTGAPFLGAAGLGHHLLRLGCPPIRCVAVLLVSEAHLLRPTCLC